MILTYDVIPSDSERESGVDEPSSESDMSTGDWEVGNHFSERDHDRVTDGTHKGVSHKQTKGSTVGKSVTSTLERQYCPRYLHHVTNAPGTSQYLSLLR